jgi:N12 class adenine-specific DNA methylase
VVPPAQPFTAPAPPPPAPSKPALSAFDQWQQTGVIPPASTAAAPTPAPAPTAFEPPAAAPPIAATPDRAADPYAFRPGEAPDQYVKRQQIANMGDVEAGLRGGLESVKSLGYGALAAGADAVGADRVKGWALQGYRDTEKAAAPYQEGRPASLEDIKLGESGGIGRAVDWAQYQFGNVLPSIAETVVAGAIGAAVGSSVPGAGTAVGTVASAAGKGLAKDWIKGQVAKYVAADVAKGVAADVAQQAAHKAVAGQIGTRLGMLASGYQMGLGDVYSETLNADQTDGNAGIAFVAALPYAVLDAVTEIGILDRIGKGVGADSLTKFAGAIFKEAGTTALKEGVTEAAQEAVLLAAGIAEGKTYTSDEVLSRLGNAGAAGAVAGGGMGGISGLARGMQQTPEQIAAAGAQQIQAEPDPAKREALRQAAVTAAAAAMGQGGKPPAAAPTPPSVNPNAGPLTNAADLAIATGATNVAAQSDQTQSTSPVSTATPLGGGGNLTDAAAVPGNIQSGAQGIPGSTDAVGNPADRGTTQAPAGVTGAPTGEPPPGPQPPTTPPVLPAPADPATTSTAEQIKAGMAALAQGAGYAGQLRTAELVAKHGETPLAKPESIAAAKASPLYHVRDNPDGTASIIGAVHPDTGQWVGVAPPGAPNVAIPPAPFVSGNETGATQQPPGADVGVPGSGARETLDGAGATPAPGAPLAVPQPPGAPAPELRPADLAATPEGPPVAPTPAAQPPVDLAPTPTPPATAAPVAAAPETVDPFKPIIEKIKDGSASLEEAKALDAEFVKRAYSIINDPNVVIRRLNSEPLTAHEQWAYDFLKSKERKLTPAQGELLDKLFWPQNLSSTPETPANGPERPPQADQTEQGAPPAVPAGTQRQAAGAPEPQGAAGADGRLEGAAVPVAPTHEAADGAPLWATATPGLYLDADGIETADRYATPVTTTPTGAPPNGQATHTTASTDATPGARGEAKPPGQGEGPGQGTGSGLGQTTTPATGDQTNVEASPTPESLRPAEGQGRRKGQGQGQTAGQRVAPTAATEGPTAAPIAREIAGQPRAYNLGRAAALDGKPSPKVPRTAFARGYADVQAEQARRKPTVPTPAAPVGKESLTTAPAAGKAPKNMGDLGAEVHANRFVKKLHDAGISAARVWTKEKIGTRIYLPGNSGYMTISDDGTLSDSDRSKVAYEPNQLYPKQRQAIAKAVKEYRKESTALGDEIFARNESTYTAATDKESLPVGADQTQPQPTSTPQTPAAPVEPGAVVEPAAKPDGNDTTAIVNAAIDSELDALFGVASDAAPPATPTPGPSRTAGRAAVRAGANVGKGLSEIASGLTALFGSPGRLGSGLTFDETSYEKAKPLFIAGVAHFKEAATDISEMVKLLVRALVKDHGLQRETIENMRPYIQRFVQDVQSGAVTLGEQPQEEPTVEPPTETPVATGEQEPIPEPTPTPEPPPTTEGPGEQTKPEKVKTPKKTTGEAKTPRVKKTTPADAKVPRGAKDRGAGTVLVRPMDAIRRALAALRATDPKHYVEAALKAATPGKVWDLPAVREGVTPGTLRAQEWLRGQLLSPLEYLGAKHGGALGKYRTSYADAIVRWLNGAERNSDRETARAAFESEVADYITTVEALGAKLSGAGNVAQVAAAMQEYLTPNAVERAKFMDMDEDGRVEGRWGRTKLFDYTVAEQADAYGKRLLEMLRAPRDKRGHKLDRIDTYFLQETNEKSPWYGFLKGEADTVTKLIEPKRPVLKKIVREGFKDVLQGREPTSELVKAEFNFAAVPVGNYVTSTSGAAHLTGSFEGLHDLAELIGADPKTDLSFGGELHYSIGKLGRGGKASAFFAPAWPIFRVTEDGKEALDDNGMPIVDGHVKAINITKAAGDGSVAHEWGHALDDALDATPEGRRMTALVKAALMHRLDPARLESVLDSILTGARSDVGYGFDTKTKRGRLDAAAAFLENDGWEFPKYGIKRETDFYDQATQLGDYWKRPQELWARSWEASIYDWMGAERRSDYLVSDFVKEGQYTKGLMYSGTPYPTGTERIAFSAMWHEMLKHVTWVDGKPKALGSFQDPLTAQRDAIRALAEELKADLRARYAALNGIESADKHYWYAYTEDRRGPGAQPPGFAAYDDAHRQGEATEALGAVAYLEPLGPEEINSFLLEPFQHEAGPSTTYLTEDERGNQVDRVGAPGVVGSEDQPTGGVRGPGAGGNAAGDLRDDSGSGEGSGRGTDITGTAVQPGDGTGVQQPAEGPDGTGGTGDATAIPATGNFSVTRPDDLIPSGKAEAFADNIRAIRLLKEIEAAGRMATPAEQAILVQFHGWGGIANELFSYRRLEPAWQRRFDALEQLLSYEEMTAARASTVNANYTDPAVVRAMWSTLERMGFAGGKVLDPSCGVGYFFAMMPKEMEAASKLMAIDLDPISARLASQVLQRTAVKQSGFEDVKLPERYFDLVVSNVPFADFAPVDKKYNPGKRFLHDYFFLKSIELVRPGGIVAFITSRGTLDKIAKGGPEVRAALAAKADLIGAVRLPENAFKEAGMTTVTTDIIFLRRKAGDKTDLTETWGESQPMELAGMEDVRAVTLDKEAGDERGTYGQKTANVNEYYHRHPEQMATRMIWRAGRYGNAYEPAMEPSDQPIGETVLPLLARLPGAVMMEEGQAAFADESMYAVSAEVGDVKDGGFAEHEGALWVKREGMLYPLDPPLKADDQARVRGYLEVMKGRRAVLNAELRQADDQELKRLRQGLRKQYDAFVKAHGPLNLKENAKAFWSDPDAPAVLALEHWDAEAQKVGRLADIFTERVVAIRQAPTHADSPLDALAAALNYRGRVDWKYMQSLTGQPFEAVREGLRGTVYNDPLAGWVTADAYLSGNVREKLTAAKTAAEVDDAYQENVAALEAIQPPDLTPQEIHANLGANWVPAETVRDFVSHLLDLNYRGQDALIVSYARPTGKWHVQIGGENGAAANRNQAAILSSTPATVTWGTKRAHLLDLLDLALNGGVPRVTDPVEYFEDGRRKVRQVVNEEQTEAARAKLEAIRDEFQRWTWADRYRSEAMGRVYNDLRNAEVLRKFQHPYYVAAKPQEAFPGQSPHEQLRDYQAGAVWRIQQDLDAYLGHEVGTGKTFEMITAGMELKRTGVKKKPMYAVLGSTVGQFRAEFLRLYPNANILTIHIGDNARQRRLALGRIANNNWDAVIVTHESFNRIPVSPDTEMKRIAQELEDLEEALRGARETDTGGGSWSARGKKPPSQAVKALEKAKKRLESKLKTLGDIREKDQGTSFEDLGVDMLFVDEAQEYKNLAFYTKLQGQVKGLGNPKGSGRAWGLFMKARYLQDTFGGGVVLASGTPVSNSVAEVYTIQRYLDYPALRASGLHHFDRWASEYGDIGVASEYAPEGGGFREVVRFRRFYNAPEMLRAVYRRLDVMTAAEAGVPRPAMTGGAPEQIVVPQTPTLAAFQETLIVRAKRVRKNPRQALPDNMLNIVTDGRKAAMDMRMIDPANPDEADSKTNKAVDTVFREYQRTTGISVKDPTDPKKTIKIDGVALVFADLGVPNKEGRFSIYDELKRKLIERGIPAAEIAFAQETSGSTDVRRAARLAQHGRVRAGKIRVYIGSTSTMGTGVNVQTRVSLLLHMDVWWNLSNWLQRNGRGIRFGNLFSEVKVLNIGAERTVDTFVWDKVQQKGIIVDKILSKNLIERTIEDVSQDTMSAGEAMAAFSGDPRIKRRADLQADVRRMAALERAYQEARRDVFGRLNRAKAWVKQALAETPEQGEYRDQLEDLTIDGGLLIFEPKRATATAFSFQEDAQNKRAGDITKALIAAYQGQANKLRAQDSAAYDQADKDWHDNPKNKGTLLPWSNYPTRHHLPPLSVGIFAGHGISATWTVKDNTRLEPHADDFVSILATKRGSYEFGADTTPRTLAQGLLAHIEGKNQDRIVGLKEAQREIPRLEAEYSKPFAQADELRDKADELDRLTADLLLSTEDKSVVVDAAAEEQADAADQGEDEESVDDQGEALFSLGNLPGVPTQTRTRSPDLPRLTQAFLDAKLQPLFAKLKGLSRAADLRVVQTEGELPAAAVAGLREARKANPSATAKAVFIPGEKGAKGTIWAVADNLADVRDGIVTVLSHEAFHSGLRQAFGPTLNPFLDELIADRQADVALYARARGLSMENLDERREAADEFLAHLAEVNAQADLPFLRRVYAAIRAWLRKAGFVLHFSDADLREIVAGVAQYNRTGEDRVRAQLRARFGQMAGERTGGWRFSTGRADTEFAPEYLADVGVDNQADPRLVPSSQAKEFDAGKTVTLYRAMSMIDGKLYPPMSAKMTDEMGNLALRKPEPVGKWMRSEERPDLVPTDGMYKGQFPLKKPGGGTTWALYAPYFHASPVPLNDQFTAAWKNDGVERPQLVTVEVEVPISEITSGYQAEGSVKKVGPNKWNSGVVASKVPGGREVVLSRYLRIKRVVPDSEVAQKIAAIVNKNRLSIPENTVTPQLRAELEKNGVRIARKGTKGDDIRYATGRAGEPSGTAGEFTESAYRPAVVAWAKARFGEQRAPDGGLAWQNFARWFGNSAMVDQAGEPVALYRGDKDPTFTTFEPDKMGTNTRTEGSKIGFFFTPNRMFAISPQYGGEVRAFYSNSENPYFVKLKNRQIETQLLSDSDKIDTNPQKVRSWLLDRGYDSVMIEGATADKHMELIILKSENVKSATDNTGAFGPSPDIRYALGGAPAGPRVASTPTLTSRIAAAFERYAPYGYNIPGRATSKRVRGWDKTVGTPRNLALNQPEFRPVYDGLSRQADSNSSYAMEAEALAPHWFTQMEQGPRAAWRSAKLVRGAMSPRELAAVQLALNEGTLAEHRYSPAELQARGLNARQVASYTQALAATHRSLDSTAQTFQAGALRALLEELHPDLPPPVRHAMSGRLSRLILGENVAEAASNAEQALSPLREDAVQRFQEARHMVTLMRGEHGADQVADTAAQQALTRAQKALDGATAKTYTKAHADLTAAQKAQQGTARALAQSTRNLDAAEMGLKQADALVKKIDATQASIDGIAERVADLKDNAYFPLMRFGQFAVTVWAEETDPVTGQTERKVVFFRKYASEAEQMDAFKAIDAAKGPGEEVHHGITSEEGHKLFRGLNMDTLALFADHIDTTSQDGKDTAALMQQYIRLAAAEASALKRTLHREGIAGYSPEAQRVLASYIVSNARLASNNLHAGDVGYAIDAIPQGHGDLRDYAINLRDYLADPGEEFAGLRQFMFAWYLGASVSSALTNLSQVPMVTAPYLTHQPGNVTRLLKNAYAQVLKGRKGRPDPATALGKAYLQAEQEGLISPQGIYNLMATARGGTLSPSGFMSGPNAQFVMTVWGGFFSLAEQANRQVTFIAAYNQALGNGLKDAGAYDYAAEAVNQTQFVMRKENRPVWARGLGAPLFTFKMFTVNYLELLARMPLKQRSLMLAALVVGAGLGGLPGADDAEDIIDTLMQWFGHNFQSKEELDRWANALLGEAIGPVVTHGISRAGLPFDIASRVGMGNLIPGTGILKPGNIGSAREQSELWGPIAGIVKDLGTATEQAARGNWSRAAYAAMPRAIKGLVDGTSAILTGEAQDRFGTPLIPLSRTESIFKAIGFNPVRVAQFNEQKYSILERDTYRKKMESAYMDHMARAALKGDAAGVQAAKEQIAGWNKTNPETPIKWTHAQLRQRVKSLKLTSSARFLKALSPELRQEAAAAFGAGG